MKSKKAMIFEPALVFVTILVLSFALVRLDAHQKDLAKDELLGSRQINIIKTYQKAENILFYIDQSAKLSAEKASEELILKGSTNPKQDFKPLLNSNLNKYLLAYSIINLPTNNYEFIVYKGKIIGYALEDIELDILDLKSNKIGKYTIRPSFNIDFDFEAVEKRLTTSPTP